MVCSAGAIVGGQGAAIHGQCAKPVVETTHGDSGGVAGQIADQGNRGAPIGQGPTVIQNQRRGRCHSHRRNRGQALGAVVGCGGVADLQRAAVHGKCAGDGVCAACKDRRAVAAFGDGPRAGDSAGQCARAGVGCEIKGARAHGGGAGVGVGAGEDPSAGATFCDSKAANCGAHTLDNALNFVIVGITATQGECAGSATSAFLANIESCRSKYQGARAVICNRSTASVGVCPDLKKAIAGISASRID